MILQLLFDFWSTWPIMKGTALLLVTLLLSIYHLDAFLTNPYHPRTARSYHRRSSHIHAAQADGGKYSHEDIVWKLRPAHGTKWWKQVSIRFASNALRIDSKLKGVDPPFCLCPKGGQAVLEAHLPKKRGKIGKFGISTQRGPPAPEIDESVQELFGIELKGANVASAALIYMFVEPEYRKKGIGELALEVVSTIHAIQGCDVTLLVADDDGSGKLVEWYEQHGFKKAPKVQDLLGSPNGKYGVTMIAGANQLISPACKLKWW